MTEEHVMTLGENRCKTLVSRPEVDASVES